MPRPPKPSAHETGWSIDPSSAPELKKATREDLARALHDEAATTKLSATPIKTALRATEQIVAEYFPALALDRTPSAAAIKAELHTLRQRLDRLDGAIAGLSTVSADLLAVQEAFDRTKLEEALGDTLIAIKSAMARLRKESRGAPRNRALETTVFRLSEIFREYHQPSIPKRRLRQKQLDFIATALVGARIVRTADTKQLARIAPHIS